MTIASAKCSLKFEREKRWISKASCLSNPVFFQKCQRCFFFPVMCLITSACSCIICVIVAVNPSDGSGVAFGILWDLSWSAMNHWATADQLAKESGCFTLRPSKLLLVEPLHSCERNKKRISKSGKILYSHPWWMFFFPPCYSFFQESARFFPDMKRAAGVAGVKLSSARDSLRDSETRLEIRVAVVAFCLGCLEFWKVRVLGCWTIRVEIRLLSIWLV